jgi:hypothetical protein
VLAVGMFLEFAGRAHEWTWPQGEPGAQMPTKDLALTRFEAIV